MSKGIWRVVPKDYRSTIKGKKYVLARDEKLGTIMVPEKSKEAKATWGKYLRK